MKYRIVERPWEPQLCRFAIEQDIGPNDFFHWVVMREFGSEEQAREFLALYVQGPRVIDEIDLEPDFIPKSRMSGGQEVAL